MSRDLGAHGPSHVVVHVHVTVDHAYTRTKPTYQPCVKDFVLTHSNCCQANTQKLDELSGEFDPISDADSNYGRVLGLAHISRTNGVIPEDMDISPERKAPVQMLYDVDGPQMTDPNYGAYLLGSQSSLVPKGRARTST
jgi:hypothetical protein